MDPDSGKWLNIARTRTLEVTLLDLMGGGTISGG